MGCEFEGFELALVLFLVNKSGSYMYPLAFWFWFCRDGERGVDSQGLVAGFLQ